MFPRSRWPAIWLLVLVGPLVCAGDEPREDPVKVDQGAEKPEPVKSLADQIAAFEQEHHEREKKFYLDLRTFRDDKQKVSELNREYGESRRKQADELIALIKEHGKDPAAFQGILVLVCELSFPLDEDLVQLVLQHHSADTRMGQLCFGLRYRSTEAWAEKLLMEAAKHPVRAVRGQATFALGDYFRPQPWGQKLSEEEEARRLAEAARYYTEVTESYADVDTPDGPGPRPARTGLRLFGHPKRSW